MTAPFFTLFFLFSIFSQGYGTPTPQTSCPGKNVFGVSVKTLSTVSSNLRGGEILAPSDAEIDSVLSNAALQAKLTVIDFTATWCGPCRSIAPMFEALSEEIDNVVFVKCDVDEAPGIAQRFSVSAMPTFVFIKGGEVVDRLMGANPQRLRELIEEHM